MAQAKGGCKTGFKFGCFGCLAFLILLTLITAIVFGIAVILGLRFRPGPGRRFALHARRTLYQEYKGHAAHECDQTDRQRFLHEVGPVALRDSQLANRDRV